MTTAEHFARWLDHARFDDEKEETCGYVLAALVDAPYMVDVAGWPEIERRGMNLARGAP